MGFETAPIQWPWVKARPRGVSGNDFCVVKRSKVVKQAVDITICRTTDYEVGAGLIPIFGRLSAYDPKYYLGQIPGGEIGDAHSITL